MADLQECQAEIRRLRGVVRELQQKREFCIETPLGKLKVYTKHEEDSAENFPGVYVDYITGDNDEGIILACVEYDSAFNGIYTHVYGEGLNETPTVSVRHEDYGIEEK